MGWNKIGVCVCVCACVRGDCFAIRWSDTNNSNYLRLRNCPMVLWKKRLLVVGGFGFLKLLVLHWSNDSSFLRYVSSKTKLTQNISHLQEWQQNPQNSKSLFMPRLIYYETFALGENPKPAQNGLISLVVVLYRFNCI